MNKISVSVLILLLTACSSKDSTKWDRLTDKYFEYDQKGFYDSARIVGEQALNQALENFPPYDMRTAKTYNNLAEMYRELGQPGKALPLYMHAIEISKTNNDSLHRVIFFTNLGLLYFGTEQFDSAKQVFENSIFITEKQKSQTDKNLITPLSSLGLIEIEKDNLVAARLYFNRALVCAITNYKPEDKEFIPIYENWGILSIKERNYDSAFYYLSESKRLQETFYGENHPSLASVYGLLGVYYHVKHKYDSALKYYEKALISRPKTNGHLVTRAHQTLYNLGRLYIDMGDSSTGNELQKKANELRAEE